MVLQGEVIVKLESLGKGIGDLLGGAKLAGQKKQPELPPGKLGMAGFLGGKAMLGSEGFGGLKKSMVGLSGPIGKMAGGMMKGGIIGVATGAISTIMGILSKALGSSSIFTGVAAQFWKIAGVMVDMLLMPLLPYMMKFIQWMMTSVMPQVMQISTLIGRALGGDVNALLDAWLVYMRFILVEIYGKLGRLLLDVIVVAFKNSFPKWMGGSGGDLTVKGYRKERKEKQQKREDESITGETGTLTEAWAQEKKNWFGFKDFYDIGNAIVKKTTQFVRYMVGDSAKTSKDITKYVDKEKNLM